MREAFCEHDKFLRERKRSETDVVGALALEDAAVSLMVELEWRHTASATGASCSRKSLLIGMGSMA